MKKDPITGPAKELPNVKNDGIISSSEAAVGFVEDKRKVARQEHTNHFTNREGHAKK